MKSVEFAVERLSRVLTDPPVAAIILGSGLAGLADSLQVRDRLPFAEIPGFPRSTAVGHKGEFVVGLLDDHPVVAVNGRLHAYEGHSLSHIGLPVHVMHQLGARLLVVSNAAGGLNPSYRAGDLMTIDSHIDLMFRKPSAAGESATDRCQSADRPTYDRELIEECQGNARRLGIPLHRGVYVGFLGPNYETRAEYRFLRRIGGDVVGMSTVPEIRTGLQLGMRMIGFSVVTNAASPDCLGTTSAEEVIAVAGTAETQMHRLVQDLLANAGRQRIS